MFFIQFSTLQHQTPNTTKSFTGPEHLGNLKTERQPTNLKRFTHFKPELPLGC